MTNKDKKDRVEKLPTVFKNEQVALGELSKGLATILKTKDTRDVKSKQTPLTGISQTYDTKCEVTENFSKLFKFIN